MPTDSAPLTITVGHSPDPDDAFMFYALAHDKIPTGRYRFRHELQDIEELNHEGQLTCQNQGLHLVVDLGVWWQEKTGLALPLGGNVVRRNLGPEVMRDVSRLLKESIRYALAHRSEALNYALQYARDMDVGLADRFVGMYVNEWTLDYGPRGRDAVQRLLDEGHRLGIIPRPVAVDFVE